MSVMKNTLNDINSILYMLEEKISEFKNIAIEAIHKEKIIFKMKRASVICRTALSA